MPRKAPNTVFEHRLSFGTYERQAIIAPIEKTLKNVAITSQVASITVAGGAVLAGTGLLLGAWGLWRFIGADPLQEVKDKVMDFNQKVGDEIIGIINSNPPGKLDDIAKEAAETVLGEGALDFPALAAQLKTASAKKAKYCVAGSQHFDEAQCIIATEEHRVANKKVQTAYREMKDSRKKSQDKGAIQATIDVFKNGLFGDD